VRLLCLSPLLALAISSCSGPCETLAERICSCEPNSIAESACVEQVRSAMEQNAPTTADEEVCDSLLDGCTCEALEAEEFEKCGLSKGG
jgi:hypothetical protein